MLIVRQRAYSIQLKLRMRCDARVRRWTQRENSMIWQEVWRKDRIEESRGKNTTLYYYYGSHWTEDNGECGVGWNECCIHTNMDGIKITVNLRNVMRTKPEHKTREMVTRTSQRRKKRKKKKREKKMSSKQQQEATAICCRPSVNAWLSLTSLRKSKAAAMPMPGSIRMVVARCICIMQ